MCARVCACVHAGGAGAGGGRGVPAVTQGLVNTLHGRSTAMYLVYYGQLGLGNFALTVIYLGCAGAALRQLLCGNRRVPIWKSTRHFFMLSILFGCLVRAAAFGTVFVVSLTQAALTNPNNQVQCKPDSQMSDSERAIDIFARIMLVLTELPTLMITSSFALFFLVWLEVFQGARYHWHSSWQLRRRWMLVYAALNLCVYALQLTLYTLVFATSCSDRQIYQQSE